MKITQEITAEIWRLYAQFVKEACATQNMDSNSLADFLGWLERNRETEYKATKSFDMNAGNLTPFIQDGN